MYAAVMCDRECLCKGSYNAPQCPYINYSKVKCDMCGKIFQTKDKKRTCSKCEEQVKFLDKYFAKK